MANPHHLARELLEAGNLAIATANRLVAAHRNLQDHQPGYPTSTIPDPVTGGSTPGLERHISDPARHALDTLEADPQRILTRSRALYDLVTNWAQAGGRLATDIDRIHNPNELSCTSCTRAGYHSHPRLDRPTDVGGRLAAKLYLCDWCYRFIRDTGVTPTEAQVMAHNQGRTVRRPSSKHANTQSQSRRAEFDEMTEV